MREERVYHDYANFKMEHHDLLKYLIENNSDLIIRFKHVIEVIDYLYEKLIDDVTYTEEEDQIFQTGFYYIAANIEETAKLLNKTYQGDIKALEERSKEVNLLLSTIDFQNELLSVDNYDQQDMDFLTDFEKELIKKLENKEIIEDKLFKTLDEKTLEIFQKLEIEYYPIDDIFLDIADELGII
jgi:hypothetical protein